MGFEQLGPGVQVAEPLKINILPISNLFLTLARPRGGLGGGGGGAILPASTLNLNNFFNIILSKQSKNFRTFFRNLSGNNLM